MKIIIVGIVCMISMLTKAQETTETFNKFQLGVNFSTDFSRIIPNSFLNDEQSKLGFTTGINGVYNLNKNFGIELGLQYANKGERTKKMTLSLMDVNTNNISIKNNSYIIHNENFIDIPAKVNYTLGSKKLKFLSSLGITTNIYINSVYKTYLENELYSKQNLHISEYKSVCLSGIGSIGVGYQFNSKSFLKIEPTFRYSILNIVKSSSTNFSIVNPGLNIGYYYSL
jgi:hypothetical protein